MKQVTTLFDQTLKVGQPRVTFKKMQWTESDSPWIYEAGGVMKDDGRHGPGTVTPDVLRKPMAVIGILLKTPSSGIDSAWVRGLN